MNIRRRQCLDSLTATNCKVILIDIDNLDRWILPEYPIHNAYYYLSSIHRSDYLRAYFMHHHGGGYSDIKKTTVSWRPFFDRLLRSNLDGVGYQELRGGVARIDRSKVDGSYHILSRRVSKFHAWLYYRGMRKNHSRLIGNRAFIFRPRTYFTRLWIANLNRRLDLLFPLLREAPAGHPRDKKGLIIDGRESRYPVPWSFLLGEILAPLSYKFSGSLGKELVPPSFSEYR
jgi:hypothetical protein